MLRADGGPQARAEGSGVTRSDSGPARIDSTAEDAEEGEQLIDVEHGPAKNRAVRHTTTREVNCPTTRSDMHL